MYAVIHACFSVKRIQYAPTYDPDHIRLVFVQCCRCYFVKFTLIPGTMCVQFPTAMLLLLPYLHYLNKVLWRHGMVSHRRLPAGARINNNNKRSRHMLSGQTSRFNPILSLVLTAKYEKEDANMPNCQISEPSIRYITCSGRITWPSFGNPNVGHSYHEKKQ